MLSFSVIHEDRARRINTIYMRQRILKFRRIAAQWDWCAPLCGRQSVLDERGEKAKVSDIGKNLTIGKSRA